ncbi:uncharacterized protein BDR25DRAFT_305393 [Lindgomyces ingoldianus]|uniref:Uncharacterized protein n=1 Tax=Lindgomyces ingoldianus TaxID=673940 RepID=A0ACB6QM53_9PLEO|nr:uncharacterized protein BDR25DRAFT_305393 [Lindgomyces ingoldianus]KAF2467605.1 hypothetical protein BDR25DRAFT_305393 [Lindgomyces ingoldianus]
MLDALQAQLLRLPRELRDIIYRYAFFSSSPIYFSRPVHPLFVSSPYTHPTIGEEALEAFYSCNTFVVGSPRSNDQWGKYLSYNPLIRHLVIHVEEELNEPAISTISDVQEYESRRLSGADPVRRNWEKLLEFPKLATLTINLEKIRDNSFSFRTFAPIIYTLRAQHPKLVLKFCVSFDTILQSAWDDPYWSHPNWAVNGINEESFNEAGPIDVTELIAPPSEDDKKYVEEFLPNRRMPMGRSVKRGLLDCNVSEKKALAKHYVVKEPALLRVLMEEHYKIYQEYQKKVRETLRANVQEDC